MDEKTFTVMMKDVAVIATTIQLILIDKGIITAEEYAEYAIKAKEIVNENTK